jgi:hypothetical protein
VILSVAYVHQDFGTGSWSHHYAPPYLACRVRQTGPSKQLHGVPAVLPMCQQQLRHPIPAAQKWT